MTRFLKYNLLILSFCGLLISCANLKLSHKTSKYTINNTLDKISRADTAFSNLINKYSQKLNGKMNIIIGYSDEDMEVKWQQPESKLPNLITDILLDIGKEYCIKNKLPHTIDIAVFNKGGIRTSLPKGEITMSRMYSLLPFKDNLVIVSMTGIQVINLLNYIAKVGGEGISGLKMGIFKKNKAANMLINGNPIKQNKTYYIITSNYLANGAGGFEAFTQRKTFRHTHLSLRNTIVKYIKTKYTKGEHLKSNLNKRIYYVE